MKKLMIIMIMMMGVLSAQDKINEKMYIDGDEFFVNNDDDAFHIHVGDNVWLITNSIQRDSTGLFTYEYNIRKSIGPDSKLVYEQKWRCPYCYRYWPVGQKCGNQDCPSKYK